MTGILSAGDACRDLWRHGLVVGSQGNASRRYDATSIEIKKSGIWCEHAIYDSNIIVNMNGSYDPKHGKPSTDVKSHLYIYNHLPDINGIVHTHSPYATAWAVSGKPIPCCMTAMADEFGGDIPITEYCDIGDDAIGTAVVRLYEKTKSTAILIRWHGVFTVGTTLKASVKSAVIAEDCAKTAWLADRMGNLYRLPQEKINQNRKRYSESYG